MRSASHRLALESFGVLIGVKANAVEVIEMLSERLEHILPTCHRIIAGSSVEHEFTIQSNSAGEHLLYEKEKLYTTCSTKDALIERLTSRIRLTVAEFAVDHVFLHAGVVAWKGNAIVIPARTYSGKSTLTVELVKQGAMYFSDEYAILRRDGMVVPFPKAISLRTADQTEQTDYPVERFKGKAAKAPAIVRWVIMTKYKQKTQWKPKKLTPAKGTLELLMDTVPIRRDPAFALDVIRQLSHNAIYLKSYRGEAKETASRILEFCDRDNAN